MASMGFPVIDTGNPYTVIDTYNTALYNNGARMPLGTLAQVPINPASIVNGRGSILVIKFVRYNSTANAAVVGGPAPVYYTDETETIVTGTMSEGVANNANSIAGLLLPNTVSISGFTAAQLNGNFVWIAVSGFVPACIAPASTAIGDAIIGATGAFTPARVAAGTAPTNQIIGWARSAVASGLCDISVSLPIW
jgi:hypothetical protein